MDEELRSALRRSGVQPKRYFIVTYRLVPEEIRYLSRGGDGDWYFLKNEQLAFRFADREEAYLQARYHTRPDQAAEINILEIEAFEFVAERLSWAELLKDRKKAELEAQLRKIQTEIAELDK